MPVLASMLPTRQNILVLSQFTLVQRAMTEIVSDLGKLNLVAPRRLSLRKIADEGVVKADVENKVRANMLFIEVCGTARRCSLAMCACIHRI